MLEFIEYSPALKNDLIQILTGSRWEFHSKPVSTAEGIEKNLATGYFFGETARTFLIKQNSSTAGYIRIFDLEDDGSPLFDIRIAEAHRGKGTGKEAVKWITDFVFSNYPSKNRLEATTRADNSAMRKVLEACGFQKESHYRQAWPDEHGKLYDCVGYSILQSEWKTGTFRPVIFNDL
jgi:RimJ/RimL family protein N-acetyltransferase